MILAVERVNQEGEKCIMQGMQQPPGQGVITAVAE